MELGFNTSSTLYDHCTSAKLSKVTVFVSFAKHKAKQKLKIFFIIILKSLFEKNVYNRPRITVTTATHIIGDNFIMNSFIIDTPHIISDVVIYCLRNLGKDIS